MAPDIKSHLCRTIDKISNNAVFDSDHCNKTEMSTIFSIHRPSFVSSFVIIYEAPVKKIGSTHGFMLQKKIASYLGLDVGSEVNLILRGKRPKTVPTNGKLRDIQKKYKHYFRLAKGTKLTDFDFSEVGYKYYIPIYTKLTTNGTSYAFVISLDILNLLGFDVDNNVELLIKKV